MWCVHCFTRVCVYTNTCECVRCVCVCVCVYFSVCVCVCVYFSMCVMDKLKISLLYFFMFFVFFLHGQTQDPPPHFLPSPVLLSLHTGSNGGECAECIGGKYKPTSGPSACTDCPSGTYATVALAAASSSLCAACPSNSESPAGLHAYMFDLYACILSGVYEYLSQVLRECVLCVGVCVACVRACVRACSCGTRDTRHTHGDT